jgi:G6PDH family F420-dependent oxidoreductase
VGSGEAINEHILGDRWPTADVRLEMLEEAIAVIRELWSGGWVHHRGRHYTVDHARLYSVPDEPLSILVSGFGPKSVAMAARVADGYVGSGPEPDLVRLYRERGGKGPAQCGMKVCWGEDEAQALETAHRIWPNEALPGELVQVLPAPQHVEQASQLVTPAMIGEVVPCGPDPEVHAAKIQEAFDAGYDEVYVQQIGAEQEGFLRFYEREILPGYA